jgi:hypothetical protein
VTRIIGVTIVSRDRTRGANARRESALTDARSRAWGIGSEGAISARVWDDARGGTYLLTGGCFRRGGRMDLGCL